MTTQMKPKRPREWFDDDAFWREMYRYMFPERRFEGAQEEVEKAVALTQPPGKAALDLCCGPGRCSIALAQDGFDVTGVDRTRYLLDQARARAKAARVKVRWVQQDMRDYVRADSFDLVLSMFTSFGYFDDKQQDLLVLQNILTSLRPGGACLIDVIAKERLAQVFKATSSQSMPDGTTLVERREVIDDWTRLRNEWILIRNGRAKTFRFHHTIYSAQELRDRLEHVGFVDVTAYGSLDGDAYGLGSPRLIMVGRKRDDIRPHQAPAEWSARSAAMNTTGER